MSRLSICGGQIAQDARASLAWTYSLRWSNPYTEPPGPRELLSVDVDVGAPVPEAIKSRWRPGTGYAICLDFPQVPIKRWSPERKVSVRKARLVRRIQKLAPLFADELIERELQDRAVYFSVEVQT
jgi:hypothetical protein